MNSTNMETNNPKRHSLAVMLLSIIAISFGITSTIIYHHQNIAMAQQHPNNNSSSNINNATSNSTIEKNKAIVMTFTKAFNDHNASELNNVVAKDIVEHRPGVQSGINSTKQFLNSLITAFPDFHTKIEHIVGEGDKVIVFTNTTGTHKGPFMFAPGIPPTGKHVWFRTADLYRITKGKIAEHWDVIEYLNMLQDLDAIKFNAPPPPSKG